jgi:hypothetical protein
MQFSIDSVFTVVAIILFALYVYLQARTVATNTAMHGAADRRLVVEEVVHAAEQMFQTQSGQERLNYVMTVLEERLPDLSLRERRQMVEAAVYRMRQSGAVLELHSAIEADDDANARWN